MNEKYGIVDIAKVVSKEIQLDKEEIETTVKVLNRLAKKMICKVGDPEKKISQIEAVGISLTNEQKKAIRDQFNQTNYPTDALKSINFWGHNCKSLAKLISNLA